MKIHHIALESDWSAARKSGSYTTSTLGRTLADEGFIHASRPDQLQQVTHAFYGKVRQPLVRLDIETDKLTSPWREDRVGDDTYPHIYGPLNLDAVTFTAPWHRSGREKAFFEVWLNEVMFRIVIVLLAMVLSVFGAFIGQRYDEESGSFVGAVIGLALGIGLIALVLKRRR